MFSESILSPMPIALFDFLGGGELLVIFLLILIFFGGEKMPEVARGLAKAIRELRKATSGVEQEFRKVLEEEPAKPASTPTGVQPATPTMLPPAPPVSVPAAQSPYSDEEVLHEDQFAPDGANTPPAASNPSAPSPSTPATAPAPASPVAPSPVAAPVPPSPNAEAPKPGLSDPNAPLGQSRP